MIATRLGSLVPVAALLVLAAACSNSDDTTTTGTPTGTSVHPSAFCTDFDTATASCGYPATCTTALESACPQIELSYSAAYMSALHDCASTIDCDVDPGEGSCLFGKVIAATATAAQSQLAADFCTACVPGSTVQAGAPDGLNCSGHAIALAQGYGRVMGVDVLALSDSAAAAAESCVAPAAAAYPGDYDNCENSFLDCVADQQQQGYGESVDAACSDLGDGG